MDQFQNAFQQAVSIKTCQMISNRKNFEQQPLYIKTGLYYCSKFQNVRLQPFHQRLTVTELLRQNGNQAFRLEKYDEAAREYEKALTIFRYINCKNLNWKNEGIIDEDLTYIDEKGKTKEQSEKVNKIKVILYLNLAASYLKLKEFSLTTSCCDEALLLEPRNIKALFRKSKAITSNINSNLEDYNQALNFLKQAKEIDPDDQSITLEIQKINQEIKNIKNQEKIGFKGMFSKPGYQKSISSNNNENQSLIGQQNIQNKIEVEKNSSNSKNNQKQAVEVNIKLDEQKAAQAARNLDGIKNLQSEKQNCNQEQNKNNLGNTEKKTKTCNNKTSQSTQINGEKKESV